MAIVPEYGAPQVAPTIGGTQGASFVDFKAPQTDPSGLKKGFDAYASAYAQEKEETDQARATEIEIDLRRKQLELLYDDQSGFMALKGSAVVKADAEGVSPLDQRLKAFDEYVKTRMAGLNADQQLAVRKSAVTLANGMYATGMQHTLQENHNYKVSQALGAMAQAQQEAYLGFDNPDILKSAIARSRAYAARAAKLNGTDAKAAMADAEKAVHSYAMYGYIAAAQKDPAMWANAKGYLTKNAAKLDGKAVYAFDSQITQGMRDYQSYVTADDAYQRMRQGQNVYQLSGGALFTSDGSTSSIGSADSAHYVFTQGIEGQQWEEGAGGVVRPRETAHADGEVGYGAGNITKSAAEFTLGVKIAPENWEKNRADQAWNRQVAVQYLEKLGQKYGDMDKAVAAFVGSVKEVDAAEAQAKKEGGVWSVYLDKRTVDAAQAVKDRLAKVQNAPVVDSATGEELSPFNPRYATAAYRRPTYDEIRDYVKRSDPLSINPQYLEATAGKTEALFSADQQAFARKRQEALDNVCQKLESGATVTQGDLAQLTYKELNAFYDYRKKWETHDTTGDLQYQTYLMAHPQDVHNMTETEVRMASRIIPKSGRPRLLKLWQEGQNLRQQRLGAQYQYQHGGQPSGETGVTITKALSILNQDDRFKRLDSDYRLYVAEYISNAAEADNAMYGLDTKDSKSAENYITGYIKREFNTDTLFGFGKTYSGDKKPLLMFKRGDYDSRARGVGQELARRRFGREPSRGEYLSALTELITRKNPQFDTAGILSESELRETTADVRLALERKVNRQWGNQKTAAEKRRIVDAGMQQVTANSTAMLRAWLLVKLGVDLSE